MRARGGSRFGQVGGHVFEADWRASDVRDADRRTTGAARARATITTEAAIAARARGLAVGLSGTAAISARARFAAELAIAAGAAFTTDRHDHRDSSELELCIDAHKREAAPATLTTFGARAGAPATATGTAARTGGAAAGLGSSSTTATAFAHGAGFPAPAERRHVAIAIQGS